MTYSIFETNEAISDIVRLSNYMLYKLRNKKAVHDFIHLYDIASDELAYFPRGYKSISFQYRGYDVYMKSVSSYNIFYIVMDDDQSVVILRILHNRQNWKHILSISEFYRSTDYR